MQSNRFLAFSLLVVVCSMTAFALPAQLSDQGTGVTYNGVLVSNGNLTITIWDDPTNASAGHLVFNQTYANAISNGSWNLLLNDSVLDLEFGKKYWKDYAINGVDIDFGSAERLPFYLTVGLIDASLGQMSLGNQSNVTGVDSLAFGVGASALDYGTAIGNGALSGTYAFAGGYDAYATGTGSVASGVGANASGLQSIALGNLAQASGENSIAIGHSAQAPEFGTAIGDGAISGTYSIAGGYDAYAPGTGAVAFGVGANASGTTSTAIGNLAIASGMDTVAVGYHAVALHENSTAIGKYSQTTAANQVVIGNSTFPLNTVIHGSLNLSDVLILQPGSAPSDPVEGMIYYNASLHKPCYYNSTAWVTFDGSTTC